MTTLKDKLEGLTCVVHRDAPATGVISYGQTHEPHCDACCKDFTYFLRIAEAIKAAATPNDLRAWQAHRRAA